MFIDMPANVAVIWTNMHAHIIFRGMANCVLM